MVLDLHATHCPKWGCLQHCRQDSVATGNTGKGEDKGVKHTRFTEWGTVNRRGGGGAVQAQGVQGEVRQPPPQLCSETSSPALPKNSQNIHKLRQELEREKGIQQWVPVTKDTGGHCHPLAPCLPVTLGAGLSPVLPSAKREDADVSSGEPCRGTEHCSQHSARLRGAGNSRCLEQGMRTASAQEGKLHYTGSLQAAEGRDMWETK